MFKFYKEDSDAYKASEDFKKYRCWKGIIKKDMAAKLGIDINMYIRIEEGQKKIDFKSAKMISEVFEINIEKIFRKLV